MGLTPRQVCIGLQPISPVLSGLQVAFYSSAKMALLFLHAVWEAARRSLSIRKHQACQAPAAPMGLLGSPPTIASADSRVRLSDVGVERG